MALIWLLIGIATIAHGGVAKDLPVQYEDLEWPDSYSFKAIRLSLTDNIIENYEMWRNSVSSRIDYNDGYVKSIVVRGALGHRYGIKYGIHPEASEDQEVEMVCSVESGHRYRRNELETILPEDLESYEYIDDEMVNDKLSAKFVYNNTEEGADTRNTLWAHYDKVEKEWVPVRFEVLEFSLYLGSKSKHEIWDFYNYSNNFTSSDPFDVKEYDCSSYAPNESKLSAKHLLFVNPENRYHVDHLFESYKNEFSKSYAHKDEHAMRRSIFKKNLRHVIEHNRRNLGYKLAINQFADKTPEEMKKHMGLLRRPEGKSGNIPFPYNDEKLKAEVDKLPAEYDLRLLGVVSKVKNQETCGSCWTFGTTAAVEGALARMNGGKLLALSNQALVDCAWAFGAAGCDGGTDNAAYEWMMEYGLPTEAEYGPYMNQDGPCDILNMTKTYPIRGYTDVAPLSIGALKVALVNHGPLSVSVHVTEAFSLYSSGIFYDPSCNEMHLNHEVSLVGYGERDGDTFWILKNSWGPAWGIGGFMYISARDNNCGVATEPTYVVF